MRLVSLRNALEVAVCSPTMTAPLDLTRRDLLTAVAGLSALPAALPASAQELPMAGRELWSWVRAQQVMDPALTYLDTAAVGPGIRASLAAEYRQLESFNTDIDAYRRNYLSASALTALLARLAALLGCGSDELTLTQGATEALNTVAQGLPLSTGDEVLIGAHAHSSALYPWLAQARRIGVVVKQVNLPTPFNAPEQALAAFAAAVTDRTRVLVLSHIQHTDGTILPVAELCAFAQQRNILAVVDGAQACGALPVNVGQLGCDFYAASLHKWLNGPYGLGVLYIRRTLLDRLPPLCVDSAVGWRDDTANVFDDAARADWPATLGKFGCNVRFLGPKLRALTATLDFREQLGAERIAARIRELAVYARLRLQQLPVQIVTPAQPGMWSGILAFKAGDLNIEQLCSALRRERIVVRPVLRANFSVVRASFHIYNSHDDVERLVRALQTQLRA
jgi:isopenicillin-N epimerase